MTENKGFITNLPKVHFFGFIKQAEEDNYCNSRRGRSHPPGNRQDNSRRSHPARSHYPDSYI